MASWYYLVQSCEERSSSGQNRRKSSLWECIVDSMALHFECRINKKRTPTDCFYWRFFPLG